MNAYLSEFGVVHTDLLSPAFISAGLLFAAIAITAFLFVLPTTALANWLVERARRVTSAERGPTRRRSQMLCAVGCLALSGLAFGIGFIVVRLCASAFVDGMLSLATRLGDQQVFEYSKALRPIVTLQAVAVSLFLLWFLQQRRFAHVLQRLTIGIVCLVFLFVQIRTMLDFGGNLYGHLPVSVGGGGPEHLILLSDRQHADIFAVLQLCEKSPRGEGPTLLTDELEWLWQFGGAMALSSGRDDSSYFVRSSECPECPIVEVPTSLVRGVIHLPNYGAPTGGK